MMTGTDIIPSQRQGVIASIIAFHLGHHFLDLIDTPLLSWDDILTWAH